MNGLDVGVAQPGFAALVAVGCVWGFALVSVVVGRNLTRSIAAAMASVGALAFLFVSELSRSPITLDFNLTLNPGLGPGPISGLAPGLGSGVGLAAIVSLVVATLVLALVQLFGWMLVDVDRDHLPPTDRGTWLARSLAFLIVGGGLALLGQALSASFETTPVGPREIVVAARVTATAARDFAVLAGLALSAALLASLMLLRDDGQER